MGDSFTAAAAAARQENRSMGLVEEEKNTRTETHKEKLK
jgi:hypothetical protein